MKPLPEVGKEYHFFDDGKVSANRHYICKVERVITPEEANGIGVVVPEYNFETGENEPCLTTLYEHYLSQMESHDWLYSPETDYFIEASCPTYDKDKLWFVRTLDGGWFSMNIQSSWQGGRLDVDGTIFDRLIKECEDEGHTDIVELYKSATYEKKQTIGA